MCVPPWAKEGQTNCLDDSGCHSTPVQISVIVSLRGGGQAASRARAEQRKALDGNYSDLSTAGAAAVYITFCTTFPGGLFGDGSAGNLQNGNAAHSSSGCFSESLTRRQRDGRDDLTEQTARGLFRSRSRLWVVVFRSTPWTPAKRFCVTLLIIYNKVLSLVYWSPPCLLRHRRRP